MTSKGHGPPVRTVEPGPLHFGDLPVQFGGVVDRWLRLPYLSQTKLS